MVWDLVRDELIDSICGMKVPRVGTVCTCSWLCMIWLDGVGGVVVLVVVVVWCV